MLELRPNCEMCDADLPPSSTHARICTYECTFCASCVDGPLMNVCPNCAGGFVPRPIRPAKSWRPGVGLEHQPAGTVRHHLGYSPEDVAAFTSVVHDTPPEQR
jgi:hypothetical protein